MRRQNLLCFDKQLEFVHLFFWQDTIWEALTAVYDAEYIPERDSMFDIYCIHHQSYDWSAPISRIALAIDSSYGCLYRTVWGFDVYPDCYVVYTGQTVYQYTNYPVSPVPHLNCNITPVSEIANALKSNLFAPNPFAGSLSMLPQDNTPLPARIVIADWSGRIVFECMDVFPDMQISTAIWPAGMYTVQAVYPEGRLRVQQLVKSN